MRPDISSPSWLVTLSRISFAVALLIAVIPPLFYFWITYRFEQAAIHIEAEINANTVQQLINKNSDLWIFELLEMEILLSQRPSKGNRIESRRIHTDSGHLVVESTDTPAPPLVSQAAPLFDAGRKVGTLEVSRSMRPVIYQSMLVGLMSLLLGISLFISTKMLPLRALHSAFKDLFEEKERALVTLESIGDAVITTDAQMRVEYLNPIAEKLTGWSSAEAHGLLMDDVFKIINELTNEPAVNPIRVCLERNEIVEMANHTVLVRRTDGKEFHIEDSAAPIRRADGSNLGAVMVFHDVSERKAVQKHMDHMAHHDALTGLPNRSLFRIQLVNAIANAERLGKFVAVLFLDLDRFKIINDSLGHQVGDQLLVSIAARLQQCVRDDDIIARMGGDEFTAILEGMAAHDHASHVAQKIIDSMAAPFRIGEHDLHITTSIGITVFPNDSKDIETLIKNADTAMYRAKELGRNNFQYFTADMNKKSADQLHYDHALYSALENGEFFLEYQPKLNLATGRIVGMEALLRWQNPKFGRVMPGQFIPLLEDSGLILPVGDWVLKSAVKQAKIWLEDGWPLVMSVNLSARQFRQKHLALTTKGILQQRGLPAHQLELELTESLLIDNVLASDQILKDLSSLGIAISLDDFGTGYSSLSYLRRYPINTVKIDKSFVTDLADRSAAAIAQTIVDLGHALDMKVIAEGVETREQMELLRKMGCDQIQGYWLSTPLPSSEVTAWLQAHSKKAVISKATV